MPRKFKTALDWAFLYEDVLTKLVEDGLASYSVGGQTFTKQNIEFYQTQYLRWKGLAEEEEGYTGGVSIVSMS